MSDTGRTDEGSEPTFAPAHGVEFAPDAAVPADAGAGDERLFEAATEPDAESVPPGAWSADPVAPATAFSVQETPHAEPPPPGEGPGEPLWEARPPEVVEPGGPRDNGWLVVTAVLVAVFVALVVGFTALWDATREDRAEPRVEDAPLVRPDDGTASSTSAAPSTTSAPSTSEPGTAAEWVTVTGSGFTAVFPAAPTEDTATVGESRFDRWTAVVDDVEYRLLVSPFPENDDEGFLRLGAVGGAVDALPPGTTQPTGEVTPVDGGIAFRFSSQPTDGTTVEGRSVVTGGQRYVLTVTTSDPPAPPDDVERFLDGLQPG